MNCDCGCRLTWRRDAFLLKFRVQRSDERGLVGKPTADRCTVWSQCFHPAVSHSHCYSFVLLIYLFIYCCDLSTRVRGRASASAAMTCCRCRKKKNPFPVRLLHLLIINCPAPSHKHKQLTVTENFPEASMQISAARLSISVLRCASQGTLSSIILHCHLTGEHLWLQWICCVLT